MGKNAFCFREVVALGTWHQLSVTALPCVCGSTNAEKLSLCSWSQVPTASRDPKSCRMKGLLLFIAVQAGHAFHPNFLLLDVSFRCKCTHISLGIILLFPAGGISLLSSSEASGPAEHSSDIIPLSLAGHQLSSPDFPALQSSFSQPTLWVCPPLQLPQALCGVPPHGMAFSLGPAQALI